MKDSLFMRACRGEKTERPPIWVMRQAGRYLPEYRELRKGRTMLEAVQTPDLAIEATLQPIRRFGFDAAILFSDLTIPFDCVGRHFKIVEGVGPVVQEPVRTAADVASLIVKPSSEITPYVFESIRGLKKELQVPLIGFTGAPFTLACYLVDGGPSKDHKGTRDFMYSEPQAWHSLMTTIVDVVVDYLTNQAEAGADALQLFDSWIGLLSEAAYREYLFPHMRELFVRLKPLGVPVIHFGTSNHHLLPVMNEAGGDVTGVCWRTNLLDAHRMFPHSPLQGNLDPALLLTNRALIQENARRIIEEGRQLPGHIFNLGHGIYPETPLDNMEALVEAVKVPKILIVGAGVTGLTTAFELEKRGYRDITLIESSERIGGKLETIVDDGLTIELGPDAVFTRKPEALELVKELGLEHEIIYPRANTFNMLIDGRLHDVPAGLLSFGTLTESHLDSVSFLSSEAKLAVLNEHNVPAGPAEDETIASFFRRRFGTEYSRLIAEPLLAGTHAGAGERLSMMALYPAYKQAEQKCGSLSGMPKQIATEGSKPTFFSLRSGLGSLPQELTKRLKFTTVRLNHSIARMNHDGRWHFTYEDGTVEAADAVVLAIPAPAASHLLSNTDRGAAELLNGIPHGSATIATMAFMSSQWPTPLEGTGFLVPDLPNQIITGGTWSSNKWPSRSADDETLVRLFLNGVHTDEAEVFEHVADFFDSAFGSCPVPTYMKLTTWENGLPQYVLGHLDLVAQIEERFEPQCLFPTGTSYRGVGIPDSIRQGRATAVKIANKFQI